MIHRSLSTLIANTEMADANYRQWFVNAVKWSRGPAAPTIPQPSSWLLFDLGVVGLIAWRRQRAT